MRFPLFLINDWGGAIILIFSTSDISFIVDQPPPMTDETGAFAVTWNADRVVSRSVMGPDIATLWAVDADFNAYATAPIAMCDIEAEELAAWCSAPGVLP